jgi:ParB family transcriptional regulator, chromosome partitioning protein
MAKKHILGTDKLFAETEQVTAIFARGDVPQQLVPLSRLVPNRFNARQAYSRETLGELIQSMQTYGFIGALDGRELPDGRVELAYGSRRLLAAGTVNIAAIPVFLHEWDDQQMRSIALIENLAREDLTLLDEANTVGQMRDLLGLSTREICERVGKPRSWVQDRLALSGAPEDVKAMVVNRPDTLRAARFISRLADPDSRRVLRERVLNQDMTTRQIQVAIQQIEQGEPVSDALTKAMALSEPPPAPVSAGLDAIAEPPAGATAPLRASMPPATSAKLDAEQADPSAGQVFTQEVPFTASFSTLQPAGLFADEPEVDVRASAQSRAMPLDSRWPSTGGPLIILACEAVEGFDAKALPQTEVSTVLDWLKQLVDRATGLIDVLEHRSTPRT